MKHVEDSNKHIIEESVCQVGHIPEKYWYSYSCLSSLRV